MSEFLTLYESLNAVFASDIQFLDFCELCNVYKINHMHGIVHGCKKALAQDMLIHICS
jgi:hypothetical protein